MDASDALMCSMLPVTLPDATADTHVCCLHTPHDSAWDRSFNVSSMPLATQPAPTLPSSAAAAYAPTSKPSTNVQYRWPSRFLQPATPTLHLHLFPYLHNPDR